MSKNLGLLLSLSIAGLSLYLSQYIGLNEVLLALGAGILLGNTIRIPVAFNTGLRTASGLILELAILLMAFGINFKHILLLGWVPIAVVLVGITLVLALTVWIGKRSNIGGSTGWFIGFGTAICGSSAIAALAPSITKDKSEIGIALAVVNLYGLIGMVVLPLVAPYFLDNVDISILLGASLHSMGNVAGAGFAMSSEVGEMAVMVKLGRIALLTPALLIFRGILHRSSGEKRTGTFLPWYLIAFVAISIIASFYSFPQELINGTKWTSNFFLATAMAAIGTKMSFRNLIQSGKRGLVFGGILFALSLLGIMGILLIL